MTEQPEQDSLLTKEDAEMKQYRSTARALALLLALTLAFSLTALPAAAEGRPSIGAIEISQYGSDQPEHNLDTYSQWVEYKTDTSERRMDVSFDADIIPEKNVDEYGISSYADNYAINISQTGDIRADTAIGINATADGSGRISVSTGDIFSGDRGIWAQAYNGGRAAVTAQNIDAVDGIFLTIQTPGRFFCLVS